MDCGNDHVLTRTIHPSPQESGIPETKLLFDGGSQPAAVRLLTEKFTFAVGHPLHRLVVKRNGAAVPDSDHHVRVLVAATVHLHTLLTYEQNSQ